MKLDLEQEGLEIVFKSWFAPVIKHLLSTGGTLKSREAHELALETQQISRAAVIIELDKAVENRYLDYSEEPGKGGFHRVYRATCDLVTFWDNLVALAQTRLEQERTRSLEE